MHHGSKLKKEVEKNGIKVKVLTARSGVNKATLYNFYKYEEITRKKIKPLLDVLGIDVEDFFTDRSGLKEGDLPYTKDERIKDLEEQLGQYKELVADKNQLIEMYKSKVEELTAKKNIAGKAL